MHTLDWLLFLGQVQFLELHLVLSCPESFELGEPLPETSQKSQFAYPQIFQNHIYFSLLAKLIVELNSNHGLARTPCLAMGSLVPDLCPTSEPGCPMQTTWKPGYLFDQSLQGYRNHPRTPPFLPPNFYISGKFDHLSVHTHTHTHTWQTHTPRQKPTPPFDAGILLKKCAFYADEYGKSRRLPILTQKHFAHFRCANREEDLSS